MGCECGGKSGGVKWHSRRDQPPCDMSKAARAAYDQIRHEMRAGRSWTPGSPIKIPEVDPL